MSSTLPFTCSTALLLSTLLGCSHQDPATNEADRNQPAAVDGKRLLRADTEPGNWMTHWRTYHEQRSSRIARKRKSHP